MESEEKKEFAGKTAIVTGAASGMGLPSAQKLAEGGANVVLCDVDAERAEAAADYITGSNYMVDGGRVVGPKNASWNE